MNSINCVTKWLRGRQYGVFLLFLAVLAQSVSADARDLISTGRFGAVSTGHERATEAALQMLERGGNAVDAAVAAGFMLAVVDPSNSGLGGDGFALLRIPGAGYEAWDASIRCPADPSSGTSDIGMPTEPALLLHMLEKYGTRSPAEVLAPAITAARSGFPVTSYLERRIDDKIQTLKDVEAVKIFAPTGRPLRTGELLCQPLLADTLMKLSESGASSFSSGPLAANLIDDMKRRGSSYTLDDILSFNVRISSPVAVSIGSYTLIGPPPPCSSVAVMAALRAVFDHERRLGQRLSLDNRLIILDRLFSRITSSLARSIQSPRRFLLDAAGPLARPFGTTDEPSFAEQAAEPSGETTHLVTWDRNGMIVSMTLTLGTHFGTGDFSPLGFFYNNELANIRHRYFNYPKDYPKDAGPLSTKSPFIILNGTSPVLAIGGAGAGRIVSNLFLILDSILHNEKSLPDAVQSPRIHVEGKKELQVEWSPLKSALSTQDTWKQSCTKPAGADYFGLISAIGAASGTLTAVGDYRRDGAAGALDIPPD